MDCKSFIVCLQKENIKDESVVKPLSSETSGAVTKQRCINLVLNLINSSDNAVDAKTTTAIVNFCENTNCA